MSGAPTSRRRRSRLVVASSTVHGTHSLSPLGAPLVSRATTPSLGHIHWVDGWMGGWKTPWLRTRARPKLGRRPTTIRVVVYSAVSAAGTEHPWIAPRGSRRARHNDGGGTQSVGVSADFPRDFPRVYNDSQSFDASARTPFVEILRGSHGSGRHGVRQGPRHRRDGGGQTGARWC